MTDANRGYSARQHHEAAILAHRQNRLADADRHYRAALLALPGDSGILHGLGVLCAQSGRVEEAAELLQRAAAAAPRDGAIRNHLGLTLQGLGRVEEAAAEFETAVRLMPDFVEALNNLGNACLALGRQADAQRAYEKVLARNPNDAAAQFGLASALKQLGRIVEARQALRHAVALAPNVPAYHRALAESEPFGESDPRLVALEELARNEDKLPDSQKAELHFALAKAYDDLKRYGPAFEHLQKGNTVYRRLVPYDEKAVMNFFRQTAEVFSPAVFAAKRGAGHPSDVPVFIVGMPRSGTTLVEQVLASHPSVFGAGETTYVQDLILAGHAGDAYPSGVASLPGDALRRLGDRYLERIGVLAPQAMRIVDKLPANFRHLGLIHLALPNARIIHMRRDPLDTCFSCYSKLFASGLNYTYDLGELGRYYKAYEALMAHWRSVLPQGVMLEVRYETLAENFADEARRIVAFCGLDWDERCLRFYETERAVRTLSEFQVRRPLFKSSIGRSRPYREWLQPLLDALG